MRLTKEVDVRARPLLALSAITLALASCTGSAPRSPNGGSMPEVSVPAAPVQTATTARGDVVLVRTVDGLATVQPGTGSVLLAATEAVSGADGTRLYTTSSRGGRSTLDTVDATTGSVISRVDVPAGLEVRVVSGSGRAVALMEVLPAGIEPWTPLPRARTTVVVADPTGARDLRTHRLRGNFEPEAFALNDSRLFMIQYLPALTPSAYRVALLGLKHGGVAPVKAPFDSPPERMPGTRLAQVLAPDGEQLYTLYSSRRPAYTERFAEGEPGEPVTFIHVLNLREGWAHCAGLPRAFWGQPRSAQAITVSPDGSQVYVVDSIRRSVAVMNTETMQTVRAAQVDGAFAGRLRTSAAVSAGGRLFVGSAGEGSAVEVFDAQTFGPLGGWDVSGALTGIGLSPDGLRLHVALEDGVEVLDAATGLRLARMSFPGIDSIEHVGTLAG